ncbi:MAG: ABC transporter permease [Gammaproteobacteria bacterium]|nr:MAG: ABC transporter permease [Gammaproteobacteria bacterium]
MILTIARREFTTMFLSPLAWVILGIMQTILGYMFLAQLDNYFTLQPQLLNLKNAPGVTDIVIASLFQLAAVILLMMMPLITMRTIAEEKRNKTLSLLISSPISMTEIVLGKFLGLFLFVVVLVSLLMLMPLSLYMGTELDAGKLFSIYLAMLLLLGSFAAIGLYLSSLTDNQTIAATSTFGALLMLWIIDWIGESIADSDSVVSYLSILQHHKSMLRGVFDSSDIAYYLILISAFLILTIRQLDRERIL